MLFRRGLVQLIFAFVCMTVCLCGCANIQSFICSDANPCPDGQICVNGACFIAPPQDGGATDGGEFDGGLEDGGLEDGGLEDGGLEDGGLKDGGLEDGGLADGGSQCKVFQETCLANVDCCSGICVETSVGQICTQPCSLDCPLGWSCKGVDPGSGIIIFICVPYEDVYCRRCVPGYCNRTGQYCSGLSDPATGQSYQFCLEACSLDGGASCPENYKCRHLDNVGNIVYPEDLDGGTPDGGLSGTSVCAPDDKMCPGCIDEDNDRYGFGRSCRGPDCFDRDDSIHPEAIDICDRIDNNCDGNTDENTDFKSDNANCGQCNISCNVPGGQLCCNGSCVNTKANAGHCGSCFNLCTGTSPLCCDGQCKDTFTDVNNCGGCANPCTNSHGTTLCKGGACSPTCAGGWGDCDGNPNNGCESDLSVVTSCSTCYSDAECDQNLQFCNLERNICERKRVNGQACGRVPQCRSNYCVDGVCCNNACQASCWHCNLGGRAGTCSLVPNNLDPGDDCTDEGAETCGLNGFCNGAGSCAFYADGTQCIPRSCDANTNTQTNRHVCLNRQCNPEGGVPPTQSCAPYVCNGTMGCWVNCQNNNQCVQDYSCLATFSKCLKNIGLSCIHGLDCHSLECVDGVCCENACNGDCMWCAHPDSLGRCKPALQGTNLRNQCTDEGPCGTTGKCDGISSVCAKYDSGTQCEPQSCQEDASTYVSQLSLPWTCNSSHNCRSNGTVSCNGYRCNGANNCYTSCTVQTSTQRCDKEHTCVGNICQLKLGKPCESNADCASGSCCGIPGSKVCTDTQNSKYHCGGCDQTCQDRNTVSNNCVNGECSPYCVADYYNYDGNNFNGCDCTEDTNDQELEGNTCGTSVEIKDSSGNIFNDNANSGNGSERIISGSIVPFEKVPPLDIDEDWYKFQAIESNVACEGTQDKFHVRIQLVNTAPYFYFEVYVGSCSASGSEKEINCRDYHFRGTCPCANNGTAANHCLSDNKWFYVKVYRDLSAPATCEPYQLKITVGNTSN